MMTIQRVLLAALLVLLPGCGRQAPLPDDPAERRRVLMQLALAPEKPETLGKFLEVRAEMQPIYERYEEAITQSSLREVSTRPLFGAALLGLETLRRTAEKAMTARGIGFDDYTRLSILVYGFWLRAVKEGPTPELRVLQVLQELEVALQRRLAKDDGSDPRARAGLENRLKSVRHQIEFTTPFATLDKQELLARLDPATRQWLEAHRAEIEKMDFRYFDTAVPAREKPKPFEGKGVTPVPEN